MSAEQTVDVPTAEEELRRQVRAREEAINVLQAKIAKLETLKEHIAKLQGTIATMRMGLVDEFAIHAPPVPHWFRPLDEKEPERLFAWPYHYAKTLVARRPAP